MQNTILRILDEVLNLRGAAHKFTADTKLRGSLPQLDSMAVVTFISVVEERLGITIPEDRIDGSAFETVGTLVRFINDIRAGDAD